MNGEKFDVGGLGVCGHQCWHSGGGSTDHTSEAERHD